MNPCVEPKMTFQTKSKNGVLYIYLNVIFSDCFKDLRNEVVIVQSFLKTALFTCCLMADLELKQFSNMRK